ncbi:MAG: hypothetical protein U9R16_08535 [Campylobacterota bacterium]|nr:hypothetical protein [Campylobacterota bacterium]
MNELNKDSLIQEIKHLISIDGVSVEINPNYLEYFDLEELEDIKIQLLERKLDQDEISKEYLDEIYDKCGTLS